MATKNQVQETPIYGIASLVCAFMSYFIFGIFLAPLGLIFGLIGFNKGEMSRILSIIGIILAVIGLAVLIVGFASLNAALQTYLK